MDSLNYLLLITHLAKEDEFLEIRSSEQTELVTDVSKGRQDNWENHWLSCINIEREWELLEGILKKQNEFKPPRNIYYSINPRTKRKMTLEAINGYCNIWADIDDYQHALQKVIQISKFAPPSIEINSGRGLHVIYRLSSRASNKQGETLCRALANFFESDYVHDRARILRLPGFANVKFEHKPRCEVLSADENIVYEPDKLQDLLKEWLPEENKATANELSERTILEFTSLDDLQLSDRIKNLIVHGRQADDKKYPSRSEADFAVIVALLKIGCSVDVIKTIFAKHKIGERTEEVGEKYLDKSIEKAIGIVASEDEVDYTNPIVEQNGKYYRKVTDGEKQISTFVFRPRYALLWGGEETIIADVLAGNEVIEPLMQLKKDSFDNKRQLLSILKRSEFCFYGGDGDTQYLLNFLSRDGLEKYNGSSYIGFFEDKFVYPGGYFYKGGTMPSKIDIYLRQAIAAEEKFKLIVSTEEEGKEVYGKWVQTAMALNEPRVVYPVLGWFSACYIKYYLDQNGICFPILNISGTAGSGKTTLLKIFQRFMGLPPEVWSAKQSHFAKVRHLGYSNCMPIVVDEFKSDIGKQHIEDWKAILRSSYGGELDSRGKSDMSTSAYQLRAPIALIGETPITSEAALTERTIAVRLDVSWLKKNGPVAELARQEALALNLPALPYHFINYVLNSMSPKTVVRDVMALISKITKKSGMGRMINNTAVVVYGLRLLDGVGKKFGCEKTFYDAAHDEDEIIDMLLQYDEDNIVKEENRTKYELDRFLESLSEMVVGNYFKNDKLPFVYEVRDRALYIPLEACIPLVNEYRNKTGQVHHCEKNELLREVRELKNCDSYIKEVSTRYYINGHRIRCVKIDIDKVAGSINIDGLVKEGYVSGEGGTHAEL